MFVLKAMEQAVHIGKLYKLESFYSSFFVNICLVVSYTLLGGNMSKETFKMFVRSNPGLLDYVKNNQMSWQKFYEMYDMYGENHSIWNNYLHSNTTSSTINSTINSSKTIGDTPIKEIFNMVKQMDLETVRKGIDGLQKAVGLMQDLTTSRRNNNNYQARPLYQHLED